MLLYTHTQDKSANFNAPHVLECIFDINHICSQNCFQQGWCEHHARNTVLPQELTEQNWIVNDCIWDYNQGCSCIPQKRTELMYTECPEIPPCTFEQWSEHLINEEDVARFTLVILGIWVNQVSIMVCNS